MRVTYRLFWTMVLVKIVSHTKKEAKGSASIHDEINNMKTAPKMLRRSAFILLFLFPCVLIWTEIILYSENNLYRHPQWIAAKRMLEFTVVGTDEFLIARASLAQNELHLGSWWGFQGLTYRKQLTPQKINIRATLTKNSYLYVLFGDPLHQSGLRISNNADKSTAYIAASAQGEIFEEKILNGQITEGPHDIQFEWSPGKIQISLDQKLLYESNSFPQQGLLTLRNGREDVRIKSVQIEERNGIFHDENFRNSQGRIQVLALVCALFLIVGVLLCLKKDKKMVLLTYLTILITAGVIGGSFYLFDFYIGSSVQQTILTKSLHQGSPLESHAYEVARYNFFRVISSWVGISPVTQDEIFRLGYPKRRYSEGPLYCDSAGCRALEPDQAPVVIHAPKKDPRILFIGTSQTVGAGADTIHQTFFALIHNYMQNHYSTSLQSMNMAISGSRSEELIRKYHEFYQPFAPDVVVINLGFNDRPKQLRANLPAFIKDLHSEGKLVLLVEEATTPEDPMDHSEAHQILEKVSKEQNAPLLRLHEYLKDPGIAKKGMLWWDPVHMTSFGQKLTADWLGPQILEAIQNNRSVHH